MDIWRWVTEAEVDLAKNGRARLAELLSVIPGYVVNHKHAQLDAVVPEAIALAREVKNPWLELFVRHWNLQSRILHRDEVKEFLPEAVRLIELASRDEARECPQSVCVTQDLAGCYAKIDGPGYAAERMALAGETLGRIDARWPCFTCISSEYALAALDDGDAEGALAFLDRQTAALAQVGRSRAARHLSGDRIEVLLRIGRLDEALAHAVAAKADVTDESDRTRRALDLAVTLARLGRLEEAIAELPALDRVLPTPSLYERWSQAALALGLAGAMENTWKLDAQLHGMQARLRENGVIRTTADIAERRARLAIARGRLGTAEACAEEIRAILPELRAPAEVTLALAALDRDIAAAKAASDAPSAARPAESAEEAIARLTDDPEIDLALIREARVRLLEDERLLLVEASALGALGRSAAAEALLRGFLADHPDASACLMTLGRRLLDRKDHGAVRDLARAALDRGPGAEMEAAARWILALSHRLSGELDQAAEELERMLVVKPGSADVELLLAALDRDAGRLEQALARLDRLVENSAAAGNWDWDRMVVATLLGRWDKVRESAKRIGMKIEGEGPIDDAWSICRIEIVEPDGEATVHHALRTGPVTARIVEIAHPRSPQHYGDEIVFEASPKNPAPKPGEEGHTYLYPTIKIRKAAGYRSFILDGASPGEAEIRALREALSAIGCAVSVRSDDSYEITPPEGKDPIVGLFAFLAVPPETPLADVHARLTDRTKGYAHPLIWPGIARELGLDDELDRQAEIIDQYGL